MAEHEDIAVKTWHIHRRLYDWVVEWAERPESLWALFWLSFAESSFFPIPPDVLLIALGISKPKKTFIFATVCSLGSILGGALGYFIGWYFFDIVGKAILEFYGIMDGYSEVGFLFNKYNAWAVGIAGFTPIPYKLFTIAAGAFKINFWIFIVASAVSRSARFFIVSGLIRAFGPKIRPIIDKYFNILSIIFVVLLVAGFILVKYFLH